MTRLFPNLIAFLFFLLIMGGVFYLSTRVYPVLVVQYWGDSFSRPVGIGETEKGGESSPDSSEKTLAPFVRGVLSGVKTAMVSSTKDSGSLDISKTQGYLKGLKTALITSRDWYDLDRELFRSQGLPIGVQVAIDTSKPTLERSTLEYQVKLIDQVQTALAVNLEDLLISSNDRSAVLSDFLGGLRRLATESASEVLSMQRVIAEYQAIMDQNLAVSQQASDAFVVETDSFITDNIDANFNQFLEARRNADEARIRVTSTQRILARLQPLSERLPLVIQAIEANFDALASGIKITPTPGVNLPLIQQ